MSLHFVSSSVSASSTCTFAPPRSPCTCAARPNVTPLDGRTKQVIASMINASVDPCVDFYEYATGKWRSSYTLPPDTAMWDFSFSQIANTTTQEEFNLLNENFPFITPFFETCKDQVRRAVCFAVCCGRPVM